MGKKSPIDNKATTKEEITLQGDGPIRVGEGGQETQNQPKTLINSTVPKVQNILRKKETTSKRDNPIVNGLKAMTRRIKYAFPNIGKDKQKIIITSIMSIIMVVGVIGVFIWKENPAWLPKNPWENKGLEEYKQQLHNPITRKLTIQGMNGETIITQTLIHDKATPLDKIPQSFVQAVIALKTPKNKGMLQGEKVARSIILQEIVDEWTAHLSNERLLEFMETKASKDDIMAYYLSTRYMGQGIIGVEAAAQHYMGKPLWSLGMAEALLLVAIMEKPLESPYLYPRLVSQRAFTLLRSMQNMGILPQDIIVQARMQLPHILWHDHSNNHPLIPMVMDEVYAILSQRQSLENLVIKTTIVAAQQRRLDDAIQAQMHQSNHYNIGAIGAMIATPLGEIKAVGGYNGTLRSNTPVYMPVQTGKILTPLFIISSLYKGMQAEQIYKEVPASPKARAFSSLNTTTTHTIAQGLHINFQKPYQNATQGETMDTMAHLIGLYAMPIQGTITPVVPFSVLEIKNNDKKQWQRGRHIPMGNTIPPAILQQLRALLQQPKVLGFNPQTSLQKLSGGVGGITPNGNTNWFMGYTQSLIVGVWISSSGTMPLRGMKDATIPANLTLSILAP